MITSFNLPFVASHFPNENSFCSTTSKQTSKLFRYVLEYSLYADNFVYIN